MSFTEFYKKRIEPFIAIGILMMLLLSGYLLYNEQILKKEISQNCGWDGKGYKCYCQKSDVMNIEGLLKGNLNLSNITFVD